MTRLPIRDPKSPWVIAWKRGNSSREKQRRETCLPAKMRARADNTRQYYRYYASHLRVAHARTHALPPRPPKFTPRRDDEHAFKQTRSLCGAAWSPLDYLERSHVGSRWKRVGRVGLMGSDTGVDDRFSIDGCGLGRGGRGAEMIRLLRYSLMTLMTAIR